MGRVLLLLNNFWVSEPSDFGQKGKQHLKEHRPNFGKQEDFDHLLLMKNKFPVNIKHANEIHSTASGFMLYYFFIHAAAITWREMEIDTQVISLSC